MTAPAVQPLPRERAPGQYEVQNEQRYRQQVDDELVQKHDRRSHLRLGRGKFLILSAPEGLEYQIGLTNGGLLTVTNNTTGVSGDFVVDWDTVDGAAARDAQILALESSVAGIPGIYATISALASVESTLEGSIATLETNVNAAFGTTNANVSTNASAIASLEGAVAIYEIIAAASGGQPARIRLKAGVGGATIELDANEVYFGAQTRFDLATETFISTTGSVRARYGTAFGAGASVVLWHGPTSVAEGSESRTNGYLALGTDGLVYHNAAALNWGATAAEAAASNAVVPVGQNLLINTDFERGLTGWREGTSSPFGSPGIVRYLDTSGSWGSARPSLVAERPGFTPTSGNTIDLYAQGPNYWGELSAAQNYGVIVTPGERLYASWLIGLFQGFSTAQVYVRFHDASNNAVSGGEVLVGSGGRIGGGLTGDPSVFDRVGGFVTVPANAKWAGVFVRGVCNGAANPIMVGNQPFMAKVSASQTTAPPYTMGPTDKKADRTADNINRGSTASRPSSPTLHFIYSNTETNVVELWTGSSWVTIATLDTPALKATVSGSYTDIRVGTGTRNTGSITITATGGAGSYTYSHQLIITDNPSAVSVTLNSPTSATFSVSSPSNSPVKLVTFIVISTITDAAGTIFQITRGGALGWES